MTARVSTVIPCYNSAPTIGAAIQSVRQQTMGDWELIVVDDGSTDSSVAVVNRTADGDPRIRLLCQPNMGPSVARNAGYNASTAKYIHFLDADDWIDSMMYQAYIDTFETDGEIDAIYCDQAFSKSPTDEVRSRRKFTKTGKLFSEFYGGNPFPPGCVILKRSLFKRTGLFDPGVPGCEDWDMWLQIARLGTVFSRIDKTYFYYRLHTGSFGKRAAMMWTSGCKVIERAFSEDPRVIDPDPKYIAGGPQKLYKQVKLDFALSCCSLAIAVGDTETATTLFTRHCADCPDVSNHSVVAASLRYNIWHATALESGNWEALWPLIGTSLFDYLSHLENSLGIDGYAGKCLQEILGYDELKAIRGSTSYKLGRAVTRFKFWN